MHTCTEIHCMHAHDVARDIGAKDWAVSGTRLVDRHGSETVTI